MPIQKVLVVDDSKTELMFLTDLLQKKGMQVRTAENADEAFFLRQAIFDHLIADQEGLDAWLYDIRHGRIL